MPFLRDLFYGLRLFRRNPAFYLLSVLIISLGIGATMASKKKKPAAQLSTEETARRLFPKQVIQAVKEKAGQPKPSQPPKPR